MKTMITLKKNEIYEAQITGYSSEGFGICRINGCTVFVAGALCGETISVRIVKVLSSCAYGIIEQVVSASDHRMEPECDCYKRCGGCSTLHMDSTEEHRFKLNKVNDALTRIGGQTVLAEEIIPSVRRNGYRNKVTFSVGFDGQEAYYGFYSARSHRVVKISKCMIHDSRACEVAQAVVDYLNSVGIRPYDEITGKGTVRHLFIRNSLSTYDFAVCITIAEGLGSHTEKLKNAIIDRCPYITGIILNVNKKPGNELLAGDFYTIYGKPEINDELCGYHFRVSPKSFFQVNPPQAEKLYRKAVEFIKPKPDETVLDLYCGIGTITMLLSEHFQTAIGVEVVPEAIENAIYNAKLNNVENTEFLCADAGQALELFLKNGTQVDAVVVDPPRKGMYEDAVHAVCAMSPRRIVYVSCNPATLARDIKVFNSHGFILDKAAAVDMFPGTAHVETVVLLTKTNI